MKVYDNEFENETKKYKGVGIHDVTITAQRGSFALVKDLCNVTKTPRE